MTAISTSWLVGSFTLSSSATIVVDGVNNAVIAAGTYYLRDASASLSLLDAILAAVTPYMTTPAIYIAKSRKIRVTAGAAFTWSIPAALQDALGFGASIASTTAATATDVSELLWSPGWPETTIGHPTGTEGWTRQQWRSTASPSGLTTRTTLKGTARTTTGLRWAQVSQARAWTADGGLPGEFERFKQVVVDPGMRWKLYSDVSEDAASTTAVTWPTAKGPYVQTREPTWAWWERAVPNSDTHTNIELHGHVVSELP